MARMTILFDLKWLFVKSQDLACKKREKWIMIEEKALYDQSYHR